MQKVIGVIYAGGDQCDNEVIYVEGDQCDGEVIYVDGDQCDGEVIYVEGDQYKFEFLAKVENRVLRQLLSNIQGAWFSGDSGNISKCICK